MLDGEGGAKWSRRGGSYHSQTSVATRPPKPVAGLLVCEAHAREGHTSERKARVAGLSCGTIFSIRPECTFRSNAFH